MSSYRITNDSEIDDEDRDYVCTLDEKSVEKARRELNEDPAERLSAVKSLRAWVKRQPHLTCATDTSAMLQILRTRKFSQLAARQMIEKMLLSIQNVPDFFSNVDPADPEIHATLDAGVMLLLPGRDDEGRRVIISHRGNADLDNSNYPSIPNVIKTMGLVFMVANQEEMTQVNGIVNIHDFTGFSLKQLSGLKWDLIINSSVDAFPGRFKAIHFFNAGKFFDFLIGVFRKFSPRKYSERVKCHSSLETIYEHVPKRMLPVEWLPDDYTGPNGGSIKDIIANVKKRIMEEEFRQKVIDGTSGKFYIDISKRPENQTEDSFRKLNVY